MPAKSKSQQRLFGMIKAMQSGELDSNEYPKIAKLAKTMSSSTVNKYASTKHGNMPDKMREVLDSQLREALFELNSIDEADISTLQQKATKEKEQALKAKMALDKERLRKLKRGGEDI